MPRLFACFGYFVAADFHFCRYEFWNIERIHERVVEFRRFLRQDKRLRCVAFGIDMNHERTGVESVDAARAEHQPSAVGAPRMVALNVVAVCRNEWLRLSGVEVQYVQVGIAMPYTEIAVRSECVDQEMPVGRHSRERNAQVLPVAVHQCVDLVPERAARGIERQRAQAVVGIAEAVG